MQGMSGNNTTTTTATTTTTTTTNNNNNINNNSNNDDVTPILTIIIAIRLIIIINSDTNRVIPGHALHEKGLQRQKVDGTLVSSQERRALFVTVINRLSTAGQPLISFPHRF